MSQTTNVQQNDAPERWELRLYVAGMTPRSTLAINTIRTLCEIKLAGRYDLQIIDIYQRPELAKSEQVIAVPTLVKQLPHPLRRLIGDLANTDRVLIGLGLNTGESA